MSGAVPAEADALIKGPRSRFGSGRRRGYEAQDGDAPRMKGLREAIRLLRSLDPNASVDMRRSVMWVGVNGAAGLTHPMLLSLFTTSAAALTGGGGALLAAPIVGYIGAKAVEIVGTGVASRYSIRASSSLLHNAEMAVWKHAKDLFRSGSSLRRSEVDHAVKTDIPDLRKALLNHARQVVQHAFRMFGAIAAPVVFTLLSIGVAPPMGLTLAMLAPVFVGTALGTHLIRGRVRRIAEEEREAGKRKQRIEKEMTPEMLRMLSSAGKDGTFLDRLDGAVLVDAGLKGLRNRKEAFASTVMTSLSAVVSLVAMVVAVRFGAPVTTGQLLSLVALNLSVTGAAIALPQAVSQLELAIGRAATGVSDVLDVKPERVDKPDARSFEPVVGRVAGIALERAAFQYGSESADVPAFRVKDVTLRLPETGLLAIVGRNGSGKSTVFGLLGDVHDPTSGRALLGDRDRRDYTLKSRVRHSSILLPQMVTLHGDTMGDVMGLFCDLAVESERQRAEGLLQRLGLQSLLVHESADWRQRPVVKGDGTPLLSGGQIQRVMLAAVLADNSGRPLLLDEPTNHLGPVELRMVWDVLEQEARTRPIVAATQNTDVVMARDIRVVVMGETEPGVSTIVEGPVRPQSLSSSSPLMDLLDTKTVVLSDATPRSTVVTGPAVVPEPPLSR